MKKATCLLLSQLMFCQFAICGDVPEGLRDIYGYSDPCEHYMLKYSMDEIRKLDDREFNLYKIQNEKCENYKKAVIELQTLQTSRNELVTQEATYNLLYYVIVGALIWWIYLEPILNPDPIVIDVPDF